MAVVIQSRFMKAAKKDPRIVKLDRMREEGIFAINTTRLMDELETLHTTRSVRILSSTDILQSAQKKLLDVTMENVAKRGRCVDIKIKAYRTQRILDEKLTAATNYLSSKYSEDLKAEFRSMDDRKRAVQSVLQDFFNLLHKLQTVEKVADLVIQDCDQTGYGITAMSKAIEMSFARERNI